MEGSLYAVCYSSSCKIVTFSLFLALRFHLSAASEASPLDTKIPPTKKLKLIKLFKAKHIGTIWARGLIKPSQNQNKRKTDPKHTGHMGSTKAFYWIPLRLNKAMVPVPVTCHLTTKHRRTDRNSNLSSILKVLSLCWLAQLTLKLSSVSLFQCLP